jgi:hypothetical protein
MSLLLAFQGTPPAEPDFIISVLSEVPEELIEDFGFELSSLIEGIPVEDLIFFLQSELSDDVSEEEGQIEYFIEDDVVDNFIDIGSEEVLDLEGDLYTFIEDDFISSLEALIEEEETPEGLTLSDLIEDLIPAETIEYLLFLNDEGEEELIIPDGWEYITHAPFDDEPPIVIVTERFNLPFIITPGRLRSF